MKNKKLVSNDLSPLGNMLGAAEEMRPYPDHVSATFNPDSVPQHIRDKMKRDRRANNNPYKGHGSGTD